jgi:hypothetical protein
MRPPPWGHHGQARAADHPQTDERKVVLELGFEGKFAGMDENRVFLEGGPVGGRGQERPLGADPCARHAAGTQARPALLAGPRVTLSRRAKTPLRRS